MLIFPQFQSQIRFLHLILNQIVVYKELKVV